MLFSLRLGVIETYHIRATKHDEIPETHAVWNHANKKCF